MAVDGTKGSAQQLHATVLEETKVDAGEGSAQQLPDATLEDQGCTTQTPGTEQSLAELFDFLGSAGSWARDCRKVDTCTKCFQHCCALGVIFRKCHFPKWQQLCR